MKNLCLVFNHFEQEHLGKDVFLTPYYLARKENLHLIVVYRQTNSNKNFPAEYRGATLKPIKTHFSYFWLWYSEWILRSLLYVIRHGKKHDYLMSFHLFFRSILLSICYKWVNPKGKMYLKLDIPDFIIYKISDREKNPIWRYLYKKCVEVTDIFSVETRSSYTQLLNVSYFKNHEDKVICLPNGFDAEEAGNLGLKPKEFSEKQNCMITVGRLGTNQKNTELLLDAITQINPEDWKFLFIGPVEPGFETFVQTYFKTHPDLEDKVLFKGNIRTKKELWDYYNNAKVFILPSRWESYGLVLNEARYFRNYILSTDVGAAADIIAGKYGKIIDDKSSVFAEYIQEIIDGEIDINVYTGTEDKSITWEHLIQKISLK